jgi:hypothetical protein
MTDVAIVIPTFKRGNVLRRSIESALACDPPATEVVIVDCDSRDGTTDVVRSFGNKVGYVERSLPNAASARNAGLHATSAPYVAFLDSDDQTLASKTSDLALTLDKHPRTVAVHGDLDIVDTAGHILSAETERTTRAIRQESLRSVSYVTLANRCIMYTSAMLIRRSALLAIKGYDETLSVYEDWDLYLRLSLEGEIRYVTCPAARYRKWDGNVSWDESARGVIAVAEKHLASLPPSLSDVDRQAAALGFLSRLAGSRYTLLETREAREAAIRALRLDIRGAMGKREVRHALTRWIIPRPLLARRRDGVSKPTSRMASSE